MKTFSLWCDFISQEFIENKDFAKLLDKGLVKGATSNPSIFKNAILKANLSAKGSDAKALYESYAISCIKAAAKELRPLYDANSDDGYISLEIDPRLHANTNASLEEALRLAGEINEPNLMIKVPASKNSIPVMKELMAKGQSVNATLIFSLGQTKACLDALEEGLEEFRNRSCGSSACASKPEPKAVISVFVSRFDALLKNNEIGIANATLCYKIIEERKNQSIRTLFASTGVKDPSLDKAYYIDALAFAHSVNTAPLDAIEAVKSIKIIEPDYARAQKVLDDTKDYSAACDKLLADGLSSFEVAFADILEAIK